MGIAFVFPGQGSQYAGMGKDFYGNFPSAKEVFQRANEALGFDLTKVIFEGGDELNKTVNTQPAILTVSFAIYTVLKELYPELKPTLVAGHSLGEYTALLSAGVLEFEDAVKLVRYRAQYMQSAVPEGEGGMAAVIGISPEEVAKLCQEVEGIVEPVNFNSPIQTVVAGQAKAVKELVKLAKSRKIKAIPLKVSVPSHSSLMKEAAEKFKEKLEEVSFKDAQIPVVQNYTAKAHTEAQEIKENLYLQLFNPVRWVESVEFMHSQGVDTFIEIGPKNVLTKLITQIVPSVKALNVEKVEDLEKLKEL
ncbi:MAG: [acyl-carrier-protein] S-malonyltransferase [Gammaproteobacteria bacterium]|nr:MAG: [acyl-carrier-protein] S-malonyltransferase [Gammaproteobacteria bacterium]